MKRINFGMILVALIALTARLEAAPRHAEAPAPTLIAQASDDVVLDGTEILIEAEAPSSLHWSPSRGFHYGHNCCRGSGDGRGARVSAQRFSGMDAAAGRPVYVRGRF